MTDFRNVAKPWDPRGIQPTRSLPDLRKELLRHGSSLESLPDLMHAGSGHPPERRGSAGSVRYERDPRAASLGVYHATTEVEVQLSHMSPAATEVDASRGPPDPLVTPTSPATPPRPAQQQLAAPPGMALPPPLPVGTIPAPPKTVARMQTRRTTRRLTDEEMGWRLPALARPALPRSRSYPPRETLLGTETSEGSSSPTRQRSLRQRAAELLGPPAVPSMPEDPSEDPVRYAQCIRLLWLAASMKAFDVVVVLLESDAANAAMCELIGDMVPMLHFTRKRDPSPPQVVVALADADEMTRRQFDFLSPKPLLIPRSVALPSLVCEVLHPTAHWSASLDDDEPTDWRRKGGADETGRPGSGGGAGGGLRATAPDALPTTRRRLRWPKGGAPARARRRCCASTMRSPSRRRARPST